MKKMIALFSLCMAGNMSASIDLSVRGEMDSSNQYFSEAANSNPSPSEEMKEERSRIKRSMAEKGYYDSDSDNAKYLLSLEKKFSENRLPKFMGENGENDFVKKPVELNLAVSKKFPSFIMKQKLIGASPLGFWITDKKGWSGYKINFRADDKTVCAYSYFNLKLSNGKPLANDKEKELINGKYSSNTVIGNDSSGYNYSVSWYTSEELKIVECAQQKFDKNELNKVKIYAELIDKNQ